ncbi:MAG: hypothetical protein IRZ10_11845 [Thermoflavifilum sp.]|nr:hypothetical protein [Thermoflavifilum sp.]MCL6515092.1 hypothetical protein [Alicyclobacillus sp.]
MKVSEVALSQDFRRLCIEAGGFDRVRYAVFHPQIWFFVGSLTALGALWLWANDGHPCVITVLCVFTVIFYLLTLRFLRCYRIRIVFAGLIEKPSVRVPMTVDAALIRDYYRILEYGFTDVDKRLLAPVFKYESSKLESGFSDASIVMTSMTALLSTYASLHANQHVLVTVLATVYFLLVILLIDLRLRSCMKAHYIVLMDLLSVSYHRRGL